ncbi:right-handed parallel beta-helix repeat-containing protein [Sphingomonas japonica]|uniref:Right handed beta helix region n=1 Tax=Sphingomonas japonica TaxID=511662 RepID=A0ABX0U4Q5_9SPHN|nr:right-handed parallel beta-helix repeat-containing protein [Sphingomonas japonica]NIJ23748.1 hypothetical protein [Sphingomonas japonica]
MRLAIPAIALAIVAVPAQTQGTAAPFTVVEQGRGYSSLADAVNAIGGGSGTIRIAPGTYRDCAVQTEGRVSFVAAQPGTAIFDGGVCEGKAVLVLRGQGSKVDGLIFSNIRVPDGNGAGIRMEQGNLVVSNAMFLDSQSGILAGADPASSIEIDHSSFAGLGKDPTGNGAHAVYIGRYGSVRVTASRFERGTGGHYLKSRAARTIVTGSSFDDSKGQDTNYLIDMPNGSTGRIADNTFVQGPNKINYSTLITVAPEGVEHSSAGMVIEGNTATLAPGFEYRTTFVGNWSDDKVTVRDNALAERITVYEDR